VTADDILIVAGGKRLEGILRFELRAPVEGMPRSFRWTISERYPQVSQIVVSPRTKCQVYLGADQVLEGWIDRYQPFYDKQQHTVQILGRGLCEDLVDCPVNVFKTGWALKATTILQAAQAIAQPFNLTVVMAPGVANVTLAPEMQTVAVYPGVPAYGFLEEYTRSVGMLMYENEKGQVVLSTGGAEGRAGSAVIEGQNVERVEGMLSSDQRFSDYYVFSQDRSLLDVGDSIVAHQKIPRRHYWRRGCASSLRNSPTLVRNSHCAAHVGRVTGASVDRSWSVPPSANGGMVRGHYTNQTRS
jgi:prophage tail gpP-like protein